MDPDPDPDPDPQHWLEHEPRQPNKLVAKIIKAPYICVLLPQDTGIYTYWEFRNIIKEIVTP